MTAALGLPIAYPFALSSVLVVTREVADFGPVRATTDVSIRRTSL
jgi:hypothetical protein